MFVVGRGVLLPPPGSEAQLSLSKGILSNKRDQVEAEHTS